MKDAIVITALTIAAILVTNPVSAAADSWQEKMLFSPSPAMLEMEQKRARVMIYHGLNDTQVARAMDSQFNRIENMMFTGTVITDVQGKVQVDPDTGAARVEDDGC